MRIYGSNATAQAANASTTRRAGSGGFSIDESDAPKSAAPAASLRTIGGIDALLALQGQDDPAERRRRAVKRGRIALDALDELKLAVLDGEPSPSTLQRLKSATAELRDSCGDQGLDSVLAEIELRLEVEIAKMAPSRQG
ncbi:MAG: flagellar assembly protein FliX [Alphaproteobacteria bacterium]|nr:flagellar assembly protein FliX [Alphaproteobacteria bacterium]